MEEAEHNGETTPVEQAKHAKEEALHLAHYEVGSVQEQSAPVPLPAPIPVPPPAPSVPEPVVVVPPPVVAAAPTPTPTPTPTPSPVPVPVPAEVSASAQIPADAPKQYSVLTVGTELAVLSPESPVRKRIFSYGKYFKSMHVVLMCGPTGQGQVQDGNVIVTPTNSPNKITRYFDALRIGKDTKEIDIVSSQDPFETGFFSWLIARHHRAPLHVQVHTDFLAPEYAAHSYINKIRVMIAGFVIKRAARVRVVSKIVGDSVAAVYGTKVPISILPIYVDLERFATAKIDPSTTHRFMNFPHKVLVVSRFEPEKNVSLAIQAFKDGAPADACLVILGDGSEYTLLERLVTKLGLDSRVFFEGFKDPAPYYAAADILLVPSEYEGYGQVIIEALAAKKPVLSTDVGIAKESGAIIAAPKDFGTALKAWFESGPRTGALTNYPYPSVDDYVRKYCDDILSVKKEKTAV